MPVLVNEDGLNVATAPAGRAVIMLKLTVQELLLPLKLTVTVYVAEFPAFTGLGD